MFGAQEDPRLASMANMLQGFSRQGGGQVMGPESGNAPQDEQAMMQNMFASMQAEQGGGGMQSGAPQNDFFQQLMAQQQAPSPMQMGGSGGAMQPMQGMQPSPFMQQSNPIIDDILSGKSNQDFMANLQSRNKMFTDMMSQSVQSKAPSHEGPGGPQEVGGSGGKTTTKGLGSLSSKYESNGNPATIARTKGDIGGASYGTYQLTTASGNATKFANSYGGALKGKKAGTAAFDAAWKAEAKKNPQKFADAQHKYIQGTHYQPAANKITKSTGYDVSKAPKAVQDAVWSMGVQHGSGGASNIFKSAGIKAGMDAATVLKKVYNERMKVDKYFKSSTSAIKASVKKRFQKELSDALKML